MRSIKAKIAKLEKEEIYDAITYHALSNTLDSLNDAEARQEIPIVFIDIGDDELTVMKPSTFMQIDLNECVETLKHAGKEK